jgi:NTE family protein
MPDPVPSSQETTALVLCGGGSHGALEVGFAKALYEVGHRPDMILGSSIGALNGAFLAAGTDFPTLERLWRAFRLRKAVRPNWRWPLHPRTRPGFLDLGPMRAILRRELPVTRFEELEVPLTVVTTDLTTGKACYWQGEGDLIEPIIASMSLPGVFPPVALRGGQHIDGGVADNAPLGRARKQGATRAFMIDCACATPCAKPPSGWLGIVGRAFEITLHRKQEVELKMHAAAMQLFRVIPGLDIAPGLLDFTSAAALIAAGYEQTKTAMGEPPLAGRARHQAGEKGAHPRQPRELRA